MKVVTSTFEILPDNQPYTRLNQSSFQNYGYWFKYQPLTKLTQEKRFGNSTNNIYGDSNEYIIGFELSNENTLTLWHIQTDNLDHIINIIQTDGMKSYLFEQDILQYEGIWNFFGIQVISDNQYQIIFFSNKLKILVIDGQFKRKQQDYYIGGYGTFLDADGTQLYFQTFKGKLTNFIELYQIITESNFDNVLSAKQDYLNTIQTITNLYFDIINFDGQSVTQYQDESYREGIRYAISMWVKSEIEQYSLPQNYSIFRASLNTKLTDTLGDNQLFIQYQVGLLPSHNIVFAMTYSFTTPIIQFQKKNVDDWIKIEDLDLMQGLKQWHFIQFEYGRTSQPNISPPVYNSLFTVILPNKNKQFNQNWNRDNHHFTGVPIYFYLGGALSQFENKFIGSISQFTFISYNTKDLQPSIKCHYTCLTCNGPTSSDCLTCSEVKNRLLSFNLCACQIGYLSSGPLDSQCELPTQKNQLIQFLETEYNCPEGYDQCEDNIVCSFGYFKEGQLCYKCPQQPTVLQDTIFCVECVLNPNSWFQDLSCRSMLKLDFNIFSQNYRELYNYKYKTNNGTLDLISIEYVKSFGCEKGYGLEHYSQNCRKCQNCLKCEYIEDIQTCLECPRYYYLHEKSCIKCGINCKQCDSNSCLDCQEGTFLTLDKINCNECSIQNCDYCYQYYQNPMTNRIAISLDLKFNQVDLSLEGIVTGCARCHDGFANQGNICIEYSKQSCLTGIMENDQFQCLIGNDQETGLQFNNCNLIENCYSCFGSYHIQPWCIQCLDGYYVQFEDGSCTTCPDICASCVNQNSLYKDSWKINIRVFYYYKFRSHYFEDFAIDTDNYEQNVVCTSCKDDYILHDKTCIPGCGETCEVCEVEKGKSVCTKCKDSQYGRVLSLDQNSQCLQCPQKCQACIQRDVYDIKALNQYFDTQITNNEHKCYLQEKGQFLDNEFNLPVNCENSKNCFKSLIVQLDIYCNSDFIKNISNCGIDKIQQCFVDFFNQEIIDYMKKLVVKEVEIILDIQDQICQINEIEISQFITKYVLSLKKTTLKLRSQNQTVLEFVSKMTLSTFSDYFISNIILKQFYQSQFSIIGLQQKITFEQIIVITIEEGNQSLFKLENVWFLVLKDVIIKEYRKEEYFLFQINNQALQNIQISIIGLSINSSHITSNSNWNVTSSGFFGITSQQNTQINLNLTDINILNSEFQNQFSFIVSNGQQIESIIQNLIIENNVFKDCQFIKFENVSKQPQFQVMLKNNSLINSILLQIPILNLQNSIFLDNKLYNSSILIKSIGSFGALVGQFIFQQIVYQQNKYDQGCQFISINQLDQTSNSVYFENYTSIDNQQKDSLNMELNYEQSLIFIKSDYVFLNYFIIERLTGTVELSIIQTQQIEIKNLTIQNSKINKIITKQIQCLSKSQNLVFYIFDTKYILIDTFVIDQLSSIDYSIIVIQSQSRLKKHQNETIILKNGQINNNSLVISQPNMQISVFQINSLQQQQIEIINLKFVKNILNVYVQDLQMQSASTILIQSDQGQVYLEGLNFLQNYVINSTNSPLSIQSELIQITNTIFLNNNVFDLQVLKNFLILNYNGKISIEQIKLKDYPIYSNGGSAHLTASQIIIKDINIKGSFGSNGGSFYIQALGISNIKISDSSILSSQTTDNINSQGGTFYIDGTKAILQLALENISIQYSKARKSGGCIYLNAQQLTFQITNLNCTNCFSINGAFILIDSSEEYTLQLILTDIILQNPEFRWFLENIIDFTFEEQMEFRDNSYLFYIPNVILEIYQLQITNGNLFGILYFDGKDGFIIKGIIIQQYSAFRTPLITLYHSYMTLNLIQIAGIQIKDVDQEQTMPKVCKNEIIQLIKTDGCSTNDLNEEQEIFSYYDQIFKDNNFNCNYQSFYLTSETSVAVFEFFNFTNNTVNIENIYINNVSYNSSYGLFSLRDFSQIVNQIKITNLYIINSKCGNGCLLVSSTNVISENNRLLINNFDEIIKSSNSSVNIYNSKFINNQANLGSGVYVIYLTVMIINTQFINNTAETLGGAIYFRSQSTYETNLLLINNQIINNKASNASGQGVYLDSITMPQLDGLENIFMENQQDFNEIPSGLQLLINNIILNKLIVKNDSQQLIEQVYIQPYKILGQKQLTDVITLPSGQSIKDYQYFDQFNQQYIPYNLSLRFILINRFKQQLYDQQIDLYLSARTNDNNFSKNYFNKNTFTYDNTTQSFNLDDIIVYYSPYELTGLEVKVESPGIKIPKYSSIAPYNIESYQNYELRFMIKTFDCQLGQFFNVITQSCEQCIGNTYSVQLDSRICVFKDDNFIDEVNSAKIQLKPGYWRAYVHSPKIDSCFHLQENCVGGWGTGNQLCLEGHIGALCEQCDLYNIRGNGSYSISSLYSCASCSSVSGNIISVILISVWTLISIVMSVQSTIQYINDHIRKDKFIKLGLLLPDQKTNPAIIIKVLSNYLQIIATITTFQLQVPPGIASVFNSIGNPINQMAYSLDCFLIDLTKINIIYFRIIWSLIMAFSYILIYQAGYLMLVLTKKTIFNISAVTTCFIYLYVYLQPNLISSLIQLVSIRYISGQSWIAGNVSYRYDTMTHTIWLLSFVIPLLLVIGLVIPIILWFGIFKNRKNLNDTKIKSIWGYLYNEYKLSSFYWETIKITQKEFIIIVLAYYEDYIPIKAALVFICLFFYSQLANIKKPYNQGMFNQLDAQQTTICAVSIILATTIYTAQQYNLTEIIWPFYMIISILNCFFVLKLLGILIYAYGQTFETQLDAIRDTITYKYPNLMNRNRYFKKILENQVLRKKRINLRFMQIKHYLLPKAQIIIQFKNQNYIIEQQKSSKLSYIRQIQVNDNINSPQTQDVRLNIERSFA